MKTLKRESESHEEILFRLWKNEKSKKKGKFDFDCEFVSVQ